MSDPYIPPQRFAHARGKINLFLASAVLGMAGIVLLVAYKQGAFVRHTPIHFYATDAFGISKGTSVKLYGLSIGEVRGLEFTGQGVKVGLSIVSDYLPRIPKGSQAKLQREGYIGAANILIVPPAVSDPAPPPIAANERIEFVAARGITEIVEDLKNQFTPVLGEMRRLFNDAKSPEGALSRAATSVGTVIEKLPATQEDARRLLREGERTVATVGGEAKAVLATGARIGTQVEQQLPALLDKLSATLDAFSDTAKRGGAAIDRAPGLIAESESLVREGRDVLDSARNSWPLSGMIEARSMRALQMDSFESAGPR